MANYIFDFDGTLADSFDTVFDWLAVKLLGQEEAGKLHRSEFRGLSMYRLARRLKAPVWRLPRLFMQGRTAMNEQIRQVDLFEGWPDTIEALKKQGHKLFIVTANRADNVQHFMERYNLESDFVAIETSIIINKAWAIRRLVRLYHLNKAETWYVGDEAYDIAAGRRAGVKTTAVSWGFNNLETLEAERPDRLIMEPSELMEGNNGKRNS